MNKSLNENSIVTDVRSIFSSNPQVGTSELTNIKANWFTRLFCIYLLSDPDSAKRADGFDYLAV